MFCLQQGYTAVMSLLLKALMTAFVVYAATRLIPKKAISHTDSLIVSLVSAGVLLGIHLFMFSPKLRQCHALERFADATKATTTVPDITADEAGLVWGSITKPPADAKVQDIYYSGDNVAITTPDNRFIGKASSADSATITADSTQTLSGLRIELYNAGDLRLQSQCKALAAGTTSDPAGLMTIPINGIVVFKHTIKGQDRYLSIQAGQLMANQQPAAGTTNHYFKLVDPNNVTDTTSILRKGATVVIMYAGDSNSEKAFIQAGTGGTFQTGATITDATKFSISPCTTACVGPNWRFTV